MPMNGGVLAEPIVDDKTNWFALTQSHERSRYGPVVSPDVGFRPISPGETNAGWRGVKLLARSGRLRRQRWQRNGQQKASADLEQAPARNMAMGFRMHVRILPIIVGGGTRRLAAFSPLSRPALNMRAGSLSRPDRLTRLPETSTDVGGSRWMGIGRECPPVVERSARRKGSGLPDNYDKRLQWKQRDDRSCAYAAAGHGLATLVTRLVGETGTPAVVRHVHLGHRHHPCGHDACLSNGQTHPCGDRRREEQCDEFPSRPVSHHNGKDYAEIH